MESDKCTARGHAINFPRAFRADRSDDPWDIPFATPTNESLSPENPLIKPIASNSFCACRDEIARAITSATCQKPLAVTPRDRTSRLGMTVWVRSGIMVTQRREEPSHRGNSNDPPRQNPQGKRYHDYTLIDIAQWPERLMTAPKPRKPPGHLPNPGTCRLWDTVSGQTSGVACSDRRRCAGRAAKGARGWQAG